MGRLAFGINLLFPSSSCWRRRRASAEAVPARRGDHAPRGLAIAGVAAFLILNQHACRRHHARHVGVRHASARSIPGRCCRRELVAPWSEVERYSAREEQCRRPAPSGADRGALQRADGHDRGRGGALADRSAAGAAHLHRDRRSRADRQRRGERRAQWRTGRHGAVLHQRHLGTQQDRHAMQAEVDSALITQPREGGPPFRIAS